MRQAMMHTWIIRTCCAIVACVASLGGAVIAAPASYPIPFDKHSDFSGFVAAYPNGQPGLALKADGLQLPWIVLVHLVATKPATDEEAAEAAYKTIFIKNPGLKYPSGGEYVVVVVFEPKVAAEKIPYSAFIFTRLANGHWQDRFTVNPADLHAISRLAFSSPAMDRYPIPFTSTPDWSGFTNRPPQTGGTASSNVLGHTLVVLTRTSDAITNPDVAAANAYGYLFKNDHRLPKGAFYILFRFYGPSNAAGFHPEYAYVFARDSAGRWKPRHVTKEELTAIECAVGRCPNI